MSAETAKPSAPSASMRKKYVVKSSAALDPYEDTDADLADKVKVDQWLVHVSAVMKEHRSPFIAAEVLLREMEVYATTLNHPDKLYLATAVPMLRYCIPSLSPDYRDVVAASLYELVPAIFFTRTPSLQATAPTNSTFNSTGGNAEGTWLSTPGGVSDNFFPLGTGSALVQGDIGVSECRARSYAECFMRVHSLFLRHKRELDRHKHHHKVESAVMDRAVVELNRLWVKLCFLSWRTHCRKIAQRKNLFRRLAQRGAAGQIMPRFIRAWRQYGHATILEVNVARSNQLTRELEALHPLEQEAKVRHERMTEEVREKTRLLEVESTRCEQTRTRLDVLEDLLAEVEDSLNSHWATWKACMSIMFGDACPLPSAFQEDLQEGTSVYIQNITDTAATYARRAKARAGKMSMKQLHDFLAFEGELTPSVPPVPGDEYALKVRNTRFVKAPTHSSSARSTVALVRQLCSPIVSPLFLSDILYGDQRKMSVVLGFLWTLYSGGHCSLFKQQQSTPATQRLLVAVDGEGSAQESMREDDEESRGDNAVSETCTHEVNLYQAIQIPPHLSSLPIPQCIFELPPEGNCGPRMVDDVVRGMSVMHECADSTDRYLFAVRRCLTSTEMNRVHDYLGHFFDQWSVLGMPMNRDKLEAVTCGLVDEAGWPVMKALFPATGICTFSDLVNYLASVAEFSGTSLMHVAEALMSQYVFDPMDILLLGLNSLDMRNFLAAQASHMQRLFEWVREDEAGASAFISRKKALMVLGRLDLTDDEAEQCWNGVLSRRAGHLERPDLELLFYVAAQYVDSSPFSQPVEKMARVLDVCVPFLLDL